MEARPLGRQPNDIASRPSSAFQLFGHSPGRRCTGCQWRPDDVECPYPPKRLQWSQVRDPSEVNPTLHGRLSGLAVCATSAHAERGRLNGPAKAAPKRAAPWLHGPTGPMGSRPDSRLAYSAIGQTGDRRPDAPTTRALALDRGAAGEDGEGARTPSDAQRQDRRFGAA